MSSTLEVARTAVLIECTMSREITSPTGSADSVFAPRRTRIMGRSNDVRVLQLPTFLSGAKYLWAAMLTLPLALPAQQPSAEYIRMGGRVVAVESPQAQAQTYGPLPEGWSTQDIGTPQSGTAGGYLDGTYTLTGTGVIWGASDSFRSIRQQLAGDGTIIARLTSMQITATYTKAGVMMRADLSPGSRNVFVGLRGSSNELFRSVRSSTGGQTGETIGAGSKTPYWLKIVRQGDVFTGYGSANGITWIQIGTSVTIPMGSTIYVGLAASSDDGTSLSTSVFDDVTVSSRPNDVHLVSIPERQVVTVSGGTAAFTIAANPLNGGSADITFAVSNLPPGATATFAPSGLTDPGVTELTILVPAGAPAGAYPLTITALKGGLARDASVALSVSAVGAGLLPPGWAKGDVGTGSAGSHTSYDNGTFSLTGTGVMWSGADRFRFAYKALVGDGTIISRLTSMQVANTYTKAGVTMREGTSPSARNVVVGLRGSSNELFRSVRSSTGGQTGETIGAGSKTPYWLKIVRQGDVFTGYGSANGITWIQIGTSVTIPMGSTIYVGLAASSDDGTSLSTSVFDNVTVSDRADDVHLVALPSAQTVASDGGTAMYTIAASPLNGSPGAVNFDVSGLPPGASAAFSPVTLTDPETTILGITTAAGTPPGSYALTVTATKGDLVRGISLALTVSASGAGLMPTGWVTEDIGTPSAGSYGIQDGGIFTLTGMGYVWGRADWFRFAYRTLVGDGTIVARMLSMQAVSTYTKAGIMMREGLSPSSRNVFIALRGAVGTRVRSSRSSSGGLTGEVTAGSSPPLRWLKLARQGDVFTGYQSADGLNWTQVGSPLTIPMGSIIHVGLAGSSDDHTILSTSVFDNVVVTSP